MFKRTAIGLGAFLISIQSHADSCSHFFETKAVPVVAKNTPVNVWSLEEGRFPDFNKIKSKDLAPSAEMAIQEIQAVIAKIKKIKNPTFENTIAPLEFSDVKMKKFAGIFWSMNSSFNDTEYKKVEEGILTRLDQFDSEIWMDQALFDKIEVVYQNRSSLDPDQKRLVEKYREGFEKSGLNLKGEKRKRFIEIKEELSLLQNQFKKNVSESEADFKLLILDKADLAGLSDSLIAKLEDTAKAEKKTGYLFTLEPTIYSEAMKKLDSSAIRKKLMLANGTIANIGKTDNASVIKKIATLRQEQADLLGYKNYSAYKLDSVMAKNVEAVIELNNKLIKYYKPFALKEEKELKDFVKSQTGSDTLEMWDRPYWIAKLLKAKHSFDEDLVKEYLEYNKVQNAIFELAGKLYGLKFIERTDLPKLNKDIQVFEVRDRNNDLLSYLMVDPFVRLGTKNPGAWMMDVFPTYKENGKRVVPIITTTTNFSKPANGEPVLLKVDEAVTMFHEFGHALHGMLSQARYPTQSGTNVARDFVELPSQFMENFFYEKEILKTFAYHYKTNELIPDAYIDTIIKLKQFRSGSATLGQVGLNLLDLAWHDNSAVKIPGSVFDIEQKIMKPIILSQNTLGTVTSTSLAHIFSGGYASGYYSYKWAEILDADAFSIFKKEGLLNQSTAERFLKTILENGGSKDPMELYMEFAGRKPSMDAMLVRDGIKKEAK